MDSLSVASRRLISLTERVEQTGLYIRLHRPGGKGHNQKRHGARRTAHAQEGMYPVVDQSGVVTRSASEAGLASVQWAKKLPSDDKRVMQEWLDGGDAQAQMGLRGSFPFGMNESIKNKAIDRGFATWQAMDSAPTYTGQMHRGMKFASDRQRDRFVNGVKESNGFFNNNLQSFSTNRKVAADFADDTFGNSVMLSVRSRTGRAIMGTAARTEFSYQQEVMSMPGSRYRLVSVSEKSFKTTEVHGGQSTRRMTVLNLVEE